MALAINPSNTITLTLKIAQKPYIVWSLGPKAIKYESLEHSRQAPKGDCDRTDPYRSEASKYQNKGRELLESRKHNEGVGIEGPKP